MGLLKHFEADAETGLSRRQHRCRSHGDVHSVALLCIERNFDLCRRTIEIRKKRIYSSRSPVSSHRKELAISRKTQVSDGGITFRVIGLAAPVREPRAVISGGVKARGAVAMEMDGG